MSTYPTQDSKLSAPPARGGRSQCVCLWFCKLFPTSSLTGVQGALVILPRPLAPKPSWTIARFLTKSRRSHGSLRLWGKGSAPAPLPIISSADLIGTPPAVEVKLHPPIDDHCGAIHVVTSDRTPCSMRDVTHAQTRRRVVFHRFWCPPVLPGALFLSPIHHAELHNIRRRSWRGSGQVREVSVRGGTTQPLGLSLSRCLRIACQPQFPAVRAVGIRTASQEEDRAAVSRCRARVHALRTPCGVWPDEHVHLGRGEERFFVSVSPFTLWIVQLQAKPGPRQTGRPRRRQHLLSQFVLEEVCRLLFSRTSLRTARQRSVFPSARRTETPKASGNTHIHCLLPICFLLPGHLSSPTNGS